MSQETSPFSILNPWGAMPPGIGFRNSPSEAARAVASRELYAAIWRPPYSQELVDLFSDPAVSIQCSAGGALERTVPEEYIFDGFPLVRRLFGSLQKSLLETCDADTPTDTGFKYRLAGAFDVVHCDKIRQNIQALVPLKGQGTLGMSPVELKQAGQGKFLTEPGLRIEECPRELVYQFATGDTIYWGDDFPHAGPTVMRPADERLVGLILTRKSKKAAVIA